MADDVNLASPTGTVAADDIGSKLYQKIKVGWGADNTWNEADTTTGKPVPIQLRGSDGTDRSNLLPVSVSSIAAGTNNIGDVDVLTLPALPTGTNNIGDVDVLTVITGTAATNLGKAVDAVAGATDTGVAVLAVRDDALTTLTPIDGDYTPLRVSSTGALHVTGSTGVTEYTEDAAAAANPAGIMMMGVRKDTLSTSEVSADGDNIALKATNKGKLHVAAEVRFADTVADVGTGTGGSATQRVVIDSAQMGTLGQTTMAASVPVVIASNQTSLPVTSTAAASELHLGEVGGKTLVKSVTLSTDTAVYASGDLIADTQQIDGFFRKTDGTGVINSITIIDEDNQGAAFNILFMSTSTSMGTENGAPNITDANLTAGLQGIVPVATTDYITMGASNQKIACIRNIGLPVMAVSGTDDIYIAVLNSTGTPTYTASGLEMRIGVLLD